MKDGLRIASAGSALFGLRAAVALPARAAAGFEADDLSIFTDHGHLLFERARNGTLAADVVLLPAEMIEDLQREGRALAQGRIELGSVAIGACVRDLGPPADVSTRHALRSALQDAEEILLTLAPTGEHMMGVIEILGLTAATEGKIRRFDKSTEVNARIAATDMRVLAFGPATEILAWRDRGVRWCGPIPEEFQVALPYAAAVLSNSGRVAESARFTALLASSAARACFRQSGVLM